MESSHNESAIELWWGNLYGPRVCEDGCMGWLQGRVEMSEAVGYTGVWR